MDNDTREAPLDHRKQPPKRSVSETLDDVIIIEPSDVIITQKKRMKLDESSKTHPIENDTAGKPVQEREDSSKKPFRNPMIRNDPAKTSRQIDRIKIKELESELVRLQDGERILRNRMIEKTERETEVWIDAGREAAEYLWNLVGQDKLAEARNSQLDSRDTWGYDKKEDWGKDKVEAFPDGSNDLQEELPSANEIMGESTPVRRYDAHGLAGQDTFQKKTLDPLKSSESKVEDPALITTPKVEKNVAWMMEQMGLDPKIFGWNADEGDWRS